MRIGIDARFFGSVGKGLGRYTQKLVENLEKIDGNSSASPESRQYYIFLRKENWDEYQPKEKNFTKVLADVPWYSLREQIFLPRILRKYNLDLLHSPHFNVPVFYSGKFVVTIHDLILLHYPTRRASALSPLIYLLKKIAYHTVIKHAVKKSEVIIAVSEHTKNDIKKYFGVSERKIRTIYEAIGISNSPPNMPAKDILEKYGIIRPYLLYVGNAYPHKNLERLVLVFRELSKRHPHLNLVFVGKEDYFYKRLKVFVKNNWAKRIVFTDFVPDGDLPIIYRESLLYVFPSLYEGFGLPPLEAMAQDTPVVSSNSSCLPEILGDAAKYFDPQGMSEMAEAIETAISDSELRQNLIQKGRERIKKFNWEKMARQTLDVYSQSGSFAK